MRNERTKSKLEEFIDDNGDKYTEHFVRAIFIGSATVGAIFGLSGETEAKKSSATTVEYSAERGDTVDEIIDGYCPSATPEERKEMVEATGLANDAVNPANPQISAGDTYTIVLHPDECALPTE